MNIPFLDLGAAYRELQSDIDAAVARSLASGWYIGGPEVEAFEQEFAVYTQAQHCVGVANGLDALHLALRAMDVGPGDEVIVPQQHLYCYMAGGKSVRGYPCASGARCPYF